MMIDRLAELFRYKQQLDDEQAGGVGYAGGEGQYTKRQRWMAEAIELLLELALESEKRERRSQPSV